MFPKTLWFTFHKYYNIMCKITTTILLVIKLKMEDVDIPTTLLNMKVITTGMSYGKKLSFPHLLFM